MDYKISVSELTGIVTLSYPNNGKTVKREFVKVTDNRVVEMKNGFGSFVYVGPSLATGNIFNNELRVEDGSSLAEVVVREFIAARKSRRI